MYPSVSNSAVALPVLLVDINGVSRIVSISTRKLYQLVADGDFPAPLRIATSARWSLKMIEAWIETQSALAKKPASVIEPRRQATGSPRFGRPSCTEIEAARVLGLSVGQMRAQQRAAVAKGV